MTLIDSPWQFLHVTDTHLGTRRSYRFRPSLDQNWRVVRRQIAATPAELLLHGGDLTRDGDTHEFEYALAREDLRSLPMPTHVIPGNMDVGNKHALHAGPTRNRDLELNMTSPRLSLFASHFGPIQWSFVHREVRFTGFYAAVAGSNLPEEKAFWSFLEKLTREPARRHHVAVMHYWPFMEKPDEPAWDITKREEYHNWYFSIDPPHRQRLLGLLREARVELLFCGHVHTGRPAQVVDGLRIIRCSAGGGTAQIDERWPDAITTPGFQRCRVSHSGIEATFVPCDDPATSEAGSYGPGGHPTLAERDYSLAQEQPPLTPDG
ncbi:MAG: metallophosphoesterase [Planctomycetota bacterium]|nr:metallophosphoesterase [Planctomycetota bacterium]